MILNRTLLNSEIEKYVQGEMSENDVVCFIKEMEAAIKYIVSVVNNVKAVCPSSEVPDHIKFDELISIHKHFDGFDDISINSIDTWSSFIIFDVTYEDCEGYKMICVPKDYLCENNLNAVIKEFTECAMFDCKRRFEIAEREYKERCKQIDQLKKLCESAVSYNQYLLSEFLLKSVK